MRLSKEARAQLPAIQALCRITTNDPYIANLFHIPLYEVQEIREMPLPEPEPEPKDGQAAKSSEVVARTHAEMGSQRLREAIERLLRKFERDHGFQAGAGKILLPAGWSEKMRRAA